MSVDNPTADGGASVTERIEKILAGSEPKQEQRDIPQAAQGQESAPETPEVESEAPEGDEPEQSDETQLSLSDVAKILGVEESALDVDEDGTVKVKTKIDGKEGAAKFQELLKSYQLQGHVDARAREAAEMHRQAQERVQQFEAFAQSKAQEFATIYGAAEKLFVEEFGGINWDDLAKNDPIGYVEKQHAYNAKMQKLSQIGQAANQERQNFIQQQEYRKQQKLASEMERLSTLVPEWKDEAVANTETKQLVSWLQSIGAHQETIAAIHASEFADAALIKALRIGMLADANKSKAAVLQKMVKAAPKLVRPGQSLNAAERNAETVKGLRQNLRKSGGSRDSFADLLMATGKV